MYYFIPITLENEFYTYIQNWINVEQGWTIITGVYSERGIELPNEYSIISNYLPDKSVIPIKTKENFNRVIKYLVGFSLEANLEDYPQYIELMNNMGIISFEESKDYIEYINNNYGNL